VDAVPSGQGEVEREEGEPKKNPNVDCREHDVEKFPREGKMLEDKIRFAETEGGDSTGGDVSRSRGRRIRQRGDGEEGEPVVVVIHETAGGQDDGGVVLAVGGVACEAVDQGGHVETQGKQGHNCRDVIRTTEGVGFQGVEEAGGGDVGRDG
jgi:hypothetical protein